MTWNELIIGRIRSLLSTEFLLAVGYLLTMFYLALEGLLTAEYASTGVAVLTLIWGKTSQKKNGK